jgi:hypothetical protein
MKKCAISLTLTIATTAASAATELTDCVTRFPTCAAVAERIGPGGRVNTLDEAWTNGWFDGYVSGVALATLQTAWCPSSAFSTVQISAIVAKYVRENPARWSDLSQKIVRTALAQAFPCKR